MASGFKVTIDSITTDGTNLFLEVRISNGLQTFPTIRPVFPVGTAASAITTYIQNIANSVPALTADIAALVGTNVTA